MIVCATETTAIPMRIALKTLKSLYCSEYLFQEKAGISVAGDTELVCYAPRYGP